MSEYLPEPLEEVPPESDDGLEAILGAEIEVMSAAGSLAYVKEVGQLQAMLEARRLVAIGRYEELRSGDEWSADLLAAETTVSIARANRDVSLAYTLRERLPNTLAALRRGLLDRARVDSIDCATSVLDDATARVVDEQLYPKAMELNPRQLADFVRKLVAEVDPDGAEERARIRREERRVSMESVG